MEKYSRKKERELEKENENLLFENQKIINVNMEHEVRKSFIEYSMSVIMQRALPDVRDGLKPGQRRVMYTMWEDHLTADRQPLKSATVVGSVLGKYHPHGDSSVYGTMVHLAQPFYMRYPLVDGHGNWGSVDGDPPAAYRYTEARMTKIADELLRDLDKEVVPMMPNFDNRLLEPVVLPSRFPNLLVNGSMGIAVGMATNIPTHNLGEVIDATVYRMDHPDCSIPDLMQFIQGPDFPTWGTIYGLNGIKEAYMTGKGRIMVRGKAEVEEEKCRIVITEIPYGVNKSQMVETMAGLVKDKRIEGIVDIRDESGQKGMRVVVEYKRDANGHVILNQLYRYSQLQDTCAVNMLALVNNEPKVLNLAQILDHYISHQESVIKRRTEFELKQALHEAHLFEGYKLAQDNIDEVISIIRSSPDQPTAKINLMKRFNGPSLSGGLDLVEFAGDETPGLSEEQAGAIVALTLGRLSGLERQKIEDRLSALKTAIGEYRAILADVNKIKQIIKDEMTEIKKKYNEERRTRIEAVANEIIDEDLIEKHTCVVTLTHAGYVKRQPTDTYTAQRRGGKGITAMTTKEEDFIEKVMSVHSHSTVLLFTNTGRVQAMRAFQIPEASRQAKGTNIVNLIQLTEGEKVTAMISVDGFPDNEYLTMITRQGIIKRTLLSEFEYQRKGGKIALTLDEGDELLYVLHTYGENDILMATAHGSAVRFSEQNVRCMGRTARGVIGMSLRGDDRVVGAVVVNDEKLLITVTENGFGKRTPFSDFRAMTNRGGMGVICQNCNGKTGALAGILAVSDDDDLMMITDQGMFIRMPASDVSVLSRSAAGVIVMRMDDGQKIANFTKIARSDEESKSGGFESAVASEVVDGGEDEGTDTEAVEIVLPDDGSETSEEI
ncbi:MAG: DNA gyrase subunit A [Clostridia bacterium]|nr:DNA gyrase subunit A [Clostridia bacterium]